MSKLYCMGELLIDFKPEPGEMTFKGNAGGAPANVCVQAAKLGQETAYISRVAKDGFGDYLIGTLRDCGVDVSNIIQTDAYDTPFTFVSLDKNGERQFKFYRQNAADLHYPPYAFRSLGFWGGDVFEFGTVALTTQSSSDVHYELASRAFYSNAIVAFDPNIRFELWPVDYKLRQTIFKFSEYANIVKLSQSEWDYLVSRDRRLPAKPTPKVFHASVLLVTDGSKGARAYLSNGKVFECPGYKVNAVDTTGAGDSFFGAFLSGIMDMHALPKDLLKLPYQEILDFACKAAAYTCTGYGAIPAMGDRQTINEAVK